MSSWRERSADELQQALKRAQRRYRLADYEDLRLSSRWSQGEPGPPYSERVLPVRPPIGDIGTVLVFKADEIGDAVLSLPAVLELRRCLPAARFFLLCRPLTEPLFERTELFDEIAAYEPGRRLLPARRRVAAALRSLSASEFDLAVFPKTYPATFREFLAVPARMRLYPLDPRLRSGSVYRPRVSLWGDQRRHQVLQLLEIASLVTERSYTFADIEFPGLRWRPEDRNAPDIVFPGITLPRYAVIHPFAKHETRRYPLEYWPPLLEALSRDLGDDLKWVSIGAREDGTLPSLRGLVQAQGQLTLMQTAFLISRATAFVGNISGPAHLAAALGIPTITLMSGYQLPAEWAPIGDTLVIRADVPCAPCARATCPVYGLACLRELVPDRVAREALAFLSSRLRGLDDVAVPSQEEA